jgi:glutamate dehydrogenase (NAD(P)+)
VLTAPVDVLIPAAREDTVDVEIAASATARLVIEGANLPTTVAAREVLHERGVVVVPAETSTTFSGPIGRSSRTAP